MNHYLRKSILSSLAVIGLAASVLPSQAQANISTVHATYNDDICYDVTCRTPYDDGYGWDDPGYDDNSGDGGGGSDDPTDPAESPICLELASNGLPSGCDRTLASSGAPLPVFQQPMSLTILFEDQGGNGAAQAIEEDARRALVACYANVSILPRECEANYVTRIESIWSNSWMTWHDRARLRSAIDDLTARFAVAENDRQWNQFFSSSALNFSFYNIRIGTNFLANLFNFGQYNQALVAARQQRLCQLWFQNWDNGNCGP
jgi:hypothetical protein